jgi:hypothetical protein
MAELARELGQLRLTKPPATGVDDRFRLRGALSVPLGAFLDQAAGRPGTRGLPQFPVRAPAIAAR